jgi:hypothetical protein
MGVLQTPTGARLALQNVYEPYKNMSKMVFHNEFFSEFFDARDWRVVYNEICDAYGGSVKHI